MKKMFIVIFIILFSKSFSQDFEKGNLSINDKAIIINELNLLGNKSINGEKTIVINFYIEKDLNPQNLCIDHYVEDKKYNKFIKKNKKIDHFFITEQGYNYEKTNVIEDKNNILKTILFQNARWCGNYIIIKPDGSYIKKYGEYVQDDIPLLCK